MKRDYIAHIRKTDGVVQSAQDHLMGTAAIAKCLTGKLGLELAGELLGLMHDFGKYSQKFQKYIESATGINPDIDMEDALPGGKKIDHSTAGAQWVYRELRKFGAAQGIGELFGQMLGLCIASHHGEGLIDCLDGEGNAVWKKRFEKDDELTHLAECEQNTDKAVQ